MNKDLPIWIIEPEFVEKRNFSARKLFKGGQKAALIQETASIDDIKQQLKKIREYARDNINSLTEELRTNLSQKYPQVRVKSASDNIEAIKYITEISDGINTISTNNSSIVSQELEPGLITNGFTVINSYPDEFDVKERKILDYWDIPFFLDKNLRGTFDVSIKMAGIDQPCVADTEIKRYLAVLGISAISAEDSTVFFLEHFSNIYNDLRQAKKVILVVGLDKIVKSRQDASFQTRCMGMFGMESALLGILPKPSETPSIAELPPLSGDKDRELHIIILDNDRTTLLESKFKDLFLCIGCRVCDSYCPAYLSGKPLTPRELILNLKKHLFEVGSEWLTAESEEKTPPLPPPRNTSADEVITKDEIWACLTCRACQEVCPVQLEHIDAIVGLRQNLVMEQAVIPDTAEVALRSIEARGHPWRGTMLTRTEWAEGLDIKTLAEDSAIDILYWVGCTEALEDRSMRIAQAMGKLLTLAGIKVGILGTEESCCGEPARCLGNEYLFQMQAEKNIELMKSYNIKKIVTACPHCYNTLKNEYPQFGGEFEVIHHTQFIANLLKEGKLRIIKGSSGVITYHDSCYLGKYNGIYEPPRQILNSMPDVTVVEMKLNRKRGFCCGGGGGHMWLEEKAGRRISEMRIEQVTETKAQIVATACPFCLQMFDDAIKAKAAEESLKVMDIAELVAESAVYRPYPS